MPLITVVVRFFGRHIFRWSRDTQEQLSVMSAYVQENLAGVRVVQAYAQEQNQVKGFAAISSAYRHNTMWLATLWGIFWPLMQVLAGIGATIVLWLGGRQVLQGTMTLGEFVAFNGYLAMLTWPLMAVGYVVNQYQRGTAALSRVFEVLDTPVSPRYEIIESPVPSTLTRGSVEFRDLTFAYAAGQAPVLKSINLVIPPGRICGIVGETASGKSTLVSLLLRLFGHPMERFVDDTDIKRYRLPKWRRHRRSRKISFFFRNDPRQYSVRRDNVMAQQEAARLHSCCRPSSPSAINSKTASASGRPPLRRPKTKNRFGPSDHQEPTDSDSRRCLLQCGRRN
jgi:ATP-binding cassette subfamily B protein